MYHRTSSSFSIRRFLPWLVSLCLLAASCKKKEESKAPSEPTETQKRASQTAADKEVDSQTVSGTADTPPGGSPKSAGSGKSPAELKPGTAKQRRLLKKAKKAFLTDDLQKAEPRFKKVIETGPMTGTKASAYIALAQIYIQSGKSGAAVDLLQTIPDPGDEIVEVRLILARAFAAQDERREAVDEYREVLDLQPNYVFVYPSLGALYTEMGDKKKAAELYLKYENKIVSMARALEHPDKSKPINRVNILDIFSAVTDERAVAAVDTALDDPNARVRAKAAATAATMKSVSSRPKLKRLASDDPNKYVRLAAKQAVDRLKNVTPPSDRSSESGAFRAPEK